MLTARRKHYFSEFPLKEKAPAVFLMTLLFLSGFWLSFNMRITGAVIYLLLWGASYMVVYAGACRHCVYYGKKCPIPLEGSCVQHFFKPGNATFGFQGLLWAVLAYFMRLFLPIFLLIKEQMIGIGIGYITVLTLFWIIHLYFTGCPNCMNFQCPLNSDYKKCIQSGKM